MVVVRVVFEKCIMMFFIVLKICLRYFNCELVYKNKEGVFDCMKVVLDKVIEIVIDCKLNGEIDILFVSIFIGIKEFKMNIEVFWENFYF